MKKSNSTETSVELCSLVQDPLLNVSSHLAYLVNDIRFLTYNWDNRCMTQNSGVPVPGIKGNTFYG